MHNISIVIPIYRGQETLPALIMEIDSLRNLKTSPGGNSYAIFEVILIHDCGPDNSDLIIQSLKKKYNFIKPVWLTKNYGQHAATLAGIANSSGDWVVTIDEDGQQNPLDIPLLLDSALSQSKSLIYALPTNKPPHGFVRNLLSTFAKFISCKIIGNNQVKKFNSFRCISGETARALAAYSASGVYFDIGLFWITSSIGYCPIQLRTENRSSSYNLRNLLSHFWRLVMTSGTRPLRAITLLGVFSVSIALLALAYALYAKFFSESIVQGWTSILVITSFFSGCIMISLGVIAEYLASTLGIMMGKPLYVISTKPPRNLE
jgi:glycosyltransferase involved in cell wall biosynthesis